MINHYPKIGLYSWLGCRNANVMAYIMDDFGNLVPISEYQFDQQVYCRIGRIY